MTKIREAWPAKARELSIQTRQNQAALKKTTLYLQTATGSAPAVTFSSRTGIAQPPPEPSKEK